MKKNIKPIPLLVLRQAKGLTQHDLAQQLNISRSLVGLYESGKRTPPLKKALKIAKFFDTPIEMIQFNSKDA